eukprot:c16756_g1_i1 orf=505-663(+)
MIICRSGSKAAQAAQGVRTCLSQIRRAFIVCHILTIILVRTVSQNKSKKLTC